ncbi:MAG: hypothetical protein ACOCYG_06970 [Spirochaetota bacterium]
MGEGSTHAVPIPGASSPAGGAADGALHFVCAAATHAVLDRAMHPFINYFAGWHRPGADQIMRFTHAFMERLLDVAVVRRFWKLQHWEVDFAAMFDLGPEMPRFLERAVRFGLRKTYKRAGRDTTLTRRLANAYADAREFYHFTNMIDPALLERRMRKGGLRTRALTIIHPPRLPEDIDFLNEEHREWTHPCDATMKRNSSFWDLYDEALEAAVPVVSGVTAAWHGRTSAPAAPPAELIRAVVTDINLSDGLQENATCRREYCDPLPLPRFLEELREEMVNQPRRQ